MSDARWNDPRESDPRDPCDQWPRVYDPRDRDEHDPREALMRDLDLPRGDERELVVDRERVYELDGEDSRALTVHVFVATIGRLRASPLFRLGEPDKLAAKHVRSDAAISGVIDRLPPLGRNVLVTQAAAGRYQV